LTGFLAFPAARDDRVIVQLPMKETVFDNLVTVNGQTVQLTEQLENLVFIDCAPA
jgi:hypothetical protein